MTTAVDKRCYTGDVDLMLNRETIGQRFGKICIEMSDSPASTPNITRITYAVSMGRSIAGHGYLGLIDFCDQHQRLLNTKKADYYSRFNIGQVSTMRLTPYSTERVSLSIDFDIDSKHLRSMDVESFVEGKFKFTFMNMALYDYGHYLNIFSILSVFGVICKSILTCVLQRSIILHADVDTDKVPLLTYFMIAYIEAISACVYVSMFDVRYPILVCAAHFILGSGALCCLFYAVMLSEPHNQEGTDGRYALCRSLFIGSLVVITIIVPVCIFQQISNNFMIWSLIPMTGLIIDNYMRAIEGCQKILSIGLLGSQVFINWAGWYILCYSAGFGGFLILGRLSICILIFCIIVLIIQGLYDPRFGIRKNIFDRNEYLFAPKPMLLEDLIKDTELGVEDVCGICLMQINPVIAQQELDHRSLEPSNSSKTEDSIQSVHTDIGDGSVAKIDKAFSHMFLKTRCGHIFHKYCLETWCEAQSKCPMCRQRVAS